VREGRRPENLGDFVVDFGHDVEEGEENFVVVEGKWLVQRKGEGGERDRGEGCERVYHVWSHEVRCF
jgi:hypothetical protein